MNSALSPCMIGKCKIDNRFVMTAANLGWCQDGYITDDIIAFYRERAKGRVGLIIAGAAGVDPTRVNKVGMMQIYDDCFIPKLKMLTKAIHKEGSKIFLQLMHAGAYAKQCEHEGVSAVAPSEYFCNFTRENVKELTKEEIAEIIHYFREGAIRAKQAGFDGVELIGSAGYLISEFLSKATNKRQDEYGGVLENRCRFLFEIIDGIRRDLGKEFPIVVRLSGSDFIPNGNNPEEFLEIGKALDGKVDAINVTGGWHESSVPQITYNVPHGMYLYLAKALKETVHIPVIGCNRLDLQKARYSIENGYSDMAGMLRSFIADPYLVKKYMDHREKDIRPCLSCNHCLEKIFSGSKLECVVNPFVGKEQDENSGEKEKKNILVIGAGVAGMAYGTMMAKNNRVTIWEKSLNYGGTLNVVSRIPYREEVGGYVDYLYRQCIFSGVTFKWNKEGKAKEIRRLLQQNKFQKVVIATGSKMEMPSYKSVGDAPIYTAEECIRTNEPKGRNIVVIGSSYKAVQTTQYLVEAGKTGDEERVFLNRYAPEYVTFANNIMRWGENKITILTEEKTIGRGFGKSTRWMMLKEIKEKGVTVETEVQIKLIEKNRIVYMVGEEEKVIPCDMVVVSEGWKKNHDLFYDLREFEERIECIGDAKRPGRISEAVGDAFRAAIN